MVRCPPGVIPGMTTAGRARFYQEYMKVSFARDVGAPEDLMCPTLLSSTISRACAKAAKDPYATTGTFGNQGCGQPITAVM